MLNQTEKPQGQRSLEYSYRDNPLIVTRGSPIPAGAVADPGRDQFRAALPAWDGGLADPVRALRR